MVLLLGGFLHNKILSIIVLSSLVTSLSVVYLYKTLETIKEKEKSNILLSLIYLFAFSNIIFTTGLETYNFAACFLIMMWYYFIRKEKEKFDTASFGTCSDDFLLYHHEYFDLWNYDRNAMDC